jgi:hypothetical protein
MTMKVRSKAEKMEHGWDGDRQMADRPGEAPTISEAKEAGTTLGHFVIEILYGLRLTKNEEGQYRTLING